MAIICLDKLKKVTHLQIKCVKRANTNDDSHSFCDLIRWSWDFNPPSEKFHFMMSLVLFCLSVFLLLWFVSFLFSLNWIKSNVNSATFVCILDMCFQQFDMPSTYGLKGKRKAKAAAATLWHQIVTKHLQTHWQHEIYHKNHHYHLTEGPQKFCTLQTTRAMCLYCLCVWLTVSFLKVSFLHIFHGNAQRCSTFSIQNSMIHDSHLFIHYVCVIIN